MPRVPRPSKAVPGAYKSATPPSHQTAYTPPPSASRLSATDHAAKTAARVTWHRSIALTLAGCTAGLIGFYGVSLYITTTRPASSQFSGPTTQSELTSVYDRTATSFDTDVGLSEWLMGITKLRKNLAAQCRGDVLEVSAGTARNLGYYRFGSQGSGKVVLSGVRSLTLVDLSQEMVEVGHRKWDVLRGTGGSKGWKDVPVRFLKADVKSEMPGPPIVDITTAVEKDEEKKTQAVAVAREGEKQGYDFVLQTMGLCSTDAPVELLQNLSLHLDSSNPDARILLLEHGQSYYDWLNKILDSQAPAHAHQHGCWWNRDIGEIVRKSGLEVVKEKRKHFGTTWLFELKPNKQYIESRKTEPVPAIATDTSAVQETSGWNSWLPRWTYEKICKR